MAVVTTFELDDLVATRVKPRASRIALIVASVPELTMRRRSMDGTSALIFLAMRVSSTQGAPKLSPSLRGAYHGVEHVGVTVTENHRSPGADVVDQFAAVLGLDPAPLARLKKTGSPPTPAKARTGEFTPPAICARASSNRVMELLYTHALLGEQIRNTVLANEVRSANNDKIVVIIVKQFHDGRDPVFVAIDQPD